MKKIVLVLLAVLLIPTHAFAYEFSIKVVNKTGGDLYLHQSAWYEGKGASSEFCTVLYVNPEYQSEYASTIVIPNNENLQYQCLNVRAEKWQRQIRIRFSCVDAHYDSSRVINYPKSKKFYDRDYPSKNGDRYTILVKKKDC